MPAAPSVGASPVVYLGASLSAEAAAAIVPGCRFEGPVARGDLYMHRAEGASVFVIIDGLFHQQLAVSPREVVDVARDGAVVFGASSMGALRAADCWPAGVRGVGLIQRLFRMGVLDTDDEVAVQLGTAKGTGTSSIALVNVRYAASKARRAGVLTRDQADALVRAAAGLFYGDRRWPLVFRRAGLASLPQETLELVSSHDLKKQDALAAMVRLGRYLELGHVPKPPSAFFWAPPDREATFDVFSGTTAEAMAKPVFEWLVGTGRCVRHIAPLLLSLVAEEGSPLTGKREALAKAAKEARAHLAAPRASSPVAVTQALLALLEEPEGLAAELWAHLDASGTLDAEVMRTRCARAASDVAQARGLVSRGRDTEIAQVEIAANFGFADWDSFYRSAPYAKLEPWVRPASEILARAKRVRSACASGESLFDG